MTQKQVERVEQLRKDSLDLLKEKKFDQATPLLNEILSIDPFDKTAARYLALVKQQAMEPYCKDAADAFQSENYAQAIDLWDKLLKMNPDDRRFATLIETTKNLITDKTTAQMHQHAEQFLKDGNYKAAINELEKIIAVRPYDHHARNLLNTTKSNMIDVKTKVHYDQAEIYLAQKQYDLAIEEWRKVLEIDESQGAASRSIASAVKEKMSGLYVDAKKSYERGDYLTARDQYNKILADNPTDLDSKTILARIEDILRITRKKLDDNSPTSEMLRKAITNYIAIDGNQRVSMVSAWYATQLSNRSDLSLAIKDFLEQKYYSILATLESPNGTGENIIEQYLFAALNNIYQGRYDLAILKLMIVTELQPTNAMAWKRLGSAYYAMGKKDKARESWERALKYAPDDAELRQSLKQMK